jgi:sugar-phosphatase
VALFIAPAGRAAALAEIDRLELAGAAAVTAVAGSVSLARMVPRDRWAVVTSGTRALAGARLEAAGLPVPPIMVTADDVQRGKPHPEGYLAAVHQLGVRAADVVVLEDSASGITAALAAGVRTVVGVGPAASATDAVTVVRDLRGVTWADGLRIEATARLR